jgi:DNA polymerase-1
VSTDITQAIGGTIGPAIPANINNLSRYEAARYYVDKLGWIVLPLYGPDQGRIKERGKGVAIKGWKQTTLEDCDPDYLAKHFGGRKGRNLGCLISGDFVHVDLDSKPDAGASVMQWLSGVPSLATVPRERTSGGVHLVFRCRDLPVSVQMKQSAIVNPINDTVTAELFIPGLPLVLSPSVHVTGHKYHWEVTGEIPLVTWADLRAWFGFSAESDKKQGKNKDKSWKNQWSSDLRTVNLPAVLGELEMLGECLDPDTYKWSILCPWRGDHSSDDGNSPDGGTVIFNQPERLPGFKCLHAHCADRKAKDLLEWIESARPGLIDSHCTRERQWNEAQRTMDGRARVVLPGVGRPDSEFATEVGSLMAPRMVWFRKGQSVCTVAMRRISEKISTLGFSPIQPVEAVTAIEAFIETGVLKEVEVDGEKTLEFIPASMSRECAGKLLASPQFREQLPEIIRILDLSLPIACGGEIVFPKLGYDARFCSYCPENAPQPVPMGLDEALGLLRELHAEFCWKNSQSLVHALARIITPYCRGLMGWDARPPLWHFAANRPRAGKDYLAAVSQLTYEGRTCEDAPIDRDSEETRKRLTAALMSGRRMMHFANCQGNIQDPHLIGIITAKTFAARNLGSTEAKSDLVMPNEIEFSLPANVGLTFREDVEPRTRRIDLEFYEENPNGRNFRKPDLHGWVLDNRTRILGAVAALVQHWMSHGCPPGKTPFNSFPEWARTVGGIMTCCGLGDPCLPHESEPEIGGDRLERAMRAIYRIGHENHPDEWISKARLFELLDAATDNDDIGFFAIGCDSLSSREARTRMGKAIRQFRSRHLGGIQLLVDDHGKGQRQSVMFTQPSSPDVVDLDTFFGTDGTGRETRSVSGDRIESRPANQGGMETSNACSRPAAVSPDEPKAVLCTSRGDLDRIAADLDGASRVALDIETYGPRKGDGLDPWKGDIRLLTVSKHGGTIWTIDLRATGYDLGPLKTVLEQTTVIAHNAKFDLLWLRLKCGLNARSVHCTLSAARLLVAGTKPGNDLDKCLERYLQIPPGTDHSRSDWASMLLTTGQLAYAARDVAYLHDLLGVMLHEIEILRLDEVWLLESKLLPCVIDMEANGIHVSLEKLMEVAAVARQREDRATHELRTALGSPTLNPASPGQLLAALRAAGLKLDSTKEESLKAVDDGRLVPLVLALREAGKQSQQAETLIKHVQTNGRIHGRFEPLGTATGRFSAKEPNLQNIGRGELREAFVAPAGRCLVVADYSQIELRAAAAIAGEGKMIDAYKSGIDLHKLTAACVMGKPVDEVTGPDRQLAKAVNFGLLYGQSAPGLVRYAAAAYGVTMTEDQARAIRGAFFRSYPRLRQWHGVSHNQAERGVSEVRTRIGRHRLIPSAASNWERFTALVNTPVQGGTADGMKRAITLVASRLPEGAMLVSTVHDELIVECPEASALECREVVTGAMVEAMAALFPEVPVEVEASICTSWAGK